MHICQVIDLTLYSTTFDRDGRTLVYNRIILYKRGESILSDDI